MDPDDERLEEALAATWSRSQATRLALEEASPEACAVAVADARTEGTGAVTQRPPERTVNLRRERAAVPGWVGAGDLGLEP